MKIKDSNKLKVGDIINYDVESNGKIPLIVAGVYSHWVLFKDAQGNKISIDNVDLVRSGIYPKSAIIKNKMPNSIHEFIDEQDKKLAFRYE